MTTCCVVIGPESSGSVFIAQVISFVIGHCRSFGQWTGYGYNGRIGADKLVLHRSIPYMRPKIFPTLLEVLGPLAGYDQIKIVLTSRDRSIMSLSTTRRMGGTPDEAVADLATAGELFAKLLDRDDVFLWSYESMTLFGAPYFQRLYRFLGVETDFVPPARDENAKYLKGTAMGP